MLILFIKIIEYLRRGNRDQTLKVSGAKAMIIEIRNTFFNHIGKLGRQIQQLPREFGTYKIQMLPGESTEQAGRRAGIKVSSYKTIVYLSAGIKNTLES